MSKSVERDQGLDAIHGLLVLYMMLMHLLGFAIGSESKFYYPLTHLLSFFMAWFFFKAGMFYKHTPVSEGLKRSSRRLLVPAVIYSLIGFLLYAILNHFRLDWYSELRTFFYSGALRGNNPMWFLFSLFLVQMLYNMIRHLRINPWVIPILSGALYITALYGHVESVFLVNVPLGLFFYSNKKEEVHFTKITKDIPALLKDVWTLGRSQGLTSLALSVNSFITNYILLKSGGEQLVAGYTVTNNVQFMFMNAFFGFIGSVSPIVGYAYGEKNPTKLSKIIKKATFLIECLSLMVALFIVAFKTPILNLYFDTDVSSATRQLASYGLNITPFCYGIFSFNILVQEFLIAVGNHKVSAFLSILENIIFANLATILLPLMFGQNGIWYIFLVAEGITFIFTCIVVYKNKDVYGYGKEGVASFLER